MATLTINGTEYVIAGDPQDVAVAGSVAVTGTFWQATQPISGNVGVTGSVAVTGPLTDSQLRATPIPVDVTFPVEQAVSIADPVAVTGDFYPTTQPISGNVGVTGSVAVTGTFWQATQPISAVSLPLMDGAATSARQDTNTAAIQKLGSAKRWFAITPADTNLATVPDAIYVGGAGNLVVRGDDGTDATFAVTAGQTVPIAPTQVRAATTATGIIGLVA